MTGKKLVKNLSYYLDQSVDIDVYCFDVHTERLLPCVIVGYNSEQPSFPGDHGHYTVSGSVNVLYQGYDDLTNTDADSMAEIVIGLMTDRTALESSLNKPLSGSDSRPLSGFGLNQLFVRGTTREDLDHSTMISINYDAYCVSKDFAN